MTLSIEDAQREVVIQENEGIWGPEAGLEFSRMRLTFELNTNFCGLGHIYIVLEALALTCGF